MKWRLGATLAVAVLALGGCERKATAPPAAPLPTPGSQSREAPLPANGAFVGKVWLSTTPGHPLGSMLIFLPDRTLVMDSCFETYRITRWGVAGNRIRWLEDSPIPIEAEVDMPRQEQLILRITGRDLEQSYSTASVPFVCPKMPH